MLAALEGYDIDIELLGGDPEAAVAAGEESCRMREELGRSAELSTTAGRPRPRVLRARPAATTPSGGRRALPSSEPQKTRPPRCSGGRPGRGCSPGAASTRRRSGWPTRRSQIGETTEDLNAKAETRADLGEVLALAGRPEDAADAIEEALARFEAKENLVRAKQMRERLAELRAEVG